MATMMTEHTYRGTIPIGEHRLYAPRTRCPCVWDWITKTIGRVAHYFRGTFSMRKLIPPIRRDLRSFSRTKQSRTATFGLDELPGSMIMTIPADMTV